MEVIKVHGLNKKRWVVEKDLILDPEKGAIISYDEDEFVLESDLDIFMPQWEQNVDGPNGFSCAFIIITNDCNKHCKYCYNEHLQLHHLGGPTTDQLINTIKEFIPDDKREYTNKPYKEFKYDYIHPIIRFIGGEPTVAPTLKPVLNWAVKNRGNKLFVCTNGINMQDPRYLEGFPKTNQICWALSVDKYTKPDFIRQWTDNIIKYGGENEYAYAIMIDPNDFQGTLELEKVFWEYSPQEIRLRGLSDEPGHIFAQVTDMIKYAEFSRGLDKQHWIEKAGWYQHTLTCLNHKDSNDPDLGNLILARLPVGRTLIAELASLQASFLMDTKSFWNPYEGHSSSPHLFKWRMMQPDKYRHPEAHKLIWGAHNPYTLAG